MSTSRVAALGVVSLALACSIVASASAKGSFSVTFAPLGTKNCGSAISATASLKNATGTTTERGLITFNGGANATFEVAAGKLASVTTAGGTLDCAKAPNLAAKVGVLNQGETTTTFSADTIEFGTKQTSVSGGTVAVYTSGAKCGGEMKLAAKFSGAPTGTTVDVTFTLGSQTPTTQTLKASSTIEWVASSKVDCGKPLPAFKFKVGTNDQTPLSPTKVTYK